MKEIFILLVIFFSWNLLLDFMMEEISNPDNVNISLTFIWDNTNIMDKYEDFNCSNSQMQGQYSDLKHTNLKTCEWGGGVGHTAPRVHSDTW